MWTSRRVWVAIAAALLGCSDPAAPPPESMDVSLIPLPRTLALAEGALTFEADAAIAVTSGADVVGELLAEVLRRSTGFAWPVAVGGSSPGQVALVLDDAADTGAEGYALDVTDRVTVTAASPAGLFYGCQTLRQLLPPEIESADAVSGVAWRVPRLHIEDRPRFAWRGTMLDVARHFFPVEDVLRQIDLAAYHKLNRFHLHLTDDQGWRIHIDAWPDLTAIGGSSEVGGGPGGFYSQADYAAIVAHAAARFVTVVPEIDMPGHVHAALASYPELNESGRAPPLYTGTEVGLSSLWIGGPSTLQFVEDVIAEVAALTPGSYLHIGGDEAQQTAAADYGTFIQSAAAIVAAHGKTLVGWEEIARASPSPPYVAQTWLTAEAGQIAAEQGAEVILSPAIHAYLDMKYDPASPIGLAWVGFVDVDRAYNWDAADFGIPEAAIAGIEAPLWTETVASRDDIDFLTFPRLSGHAEIAWTEPAQRNWEDYRARLAVHGRRLEALGVRFHPSALVDW